MPIYTTPPTQSTIFQLIHKNSTKSNMKKQGVYVFLNSLLFALLLLSYSKSISARPLPQNQGEMVVKPDGITRTHINKFKGVEEDHVNPMGSEECGENEEECLKRRMIADAHLDYIYTQNHKP